MSLRQSCQETKAAGRRGAAFIVSQSPADDRTCKAGIIGAFPALNGPTAIAARRMAGGRSPRHWPTHDCQTPERPAAPFAVNQIVHKSNARLEQDLMLCVKYKVPIVISRSGPCRR